MKVYFATDHAGFEMKNELVAYVRDVLGHDTEDCGAYTYEKDDDYTDTIPPGVKAVSDDPEHARAIILGASGQGEAICANRFPHVRAVVYYHHDLDIIRLSREHNNANVLSLAARFLSIEEAKQAVSLWLSTPFTEESRHVRRIQKLG